MKKDPLSIINSMILNLNLLEPYQKYNINELKFIKDLDMHWITIKKYLKIISLVQDYAPLLDIEDSKFTIINSDIFNHLNDKEKYVIALFNRKAMNQDSAIVIPIEFCNTINESIGYLFEKTSDNRFYLNEVGLDLYKSIKQDILDLIYEEKSIGEVFFENEEVFDNFDDLNEEFEIHFQSTAYFYHTQEGSILVPREEHFFFNNIDNEKEVTINI